jgi:predicted membrane-bound spermidine synthase
MTQVPSPNIRQLPILVGLLGALVGAALFYGVTTNIALALILGAPIGMLIGIIAYRTVPRLMRRPESRTAQLNGAAPAPPTIEEQAKPDFRMKINS